MNDCTQEAMLRCMHVLRSLAVGPIITEPNAKTKQSQWAMKYRSRSNIDDYI